MNGSREREKYDSDKGEVRNIFASYRTSKWITKTPRGSGKSVQVGIHSYRTRPLVPRAFSKSQHQHQNTIQTLQSSSTSPHTSTPTTSTAHTPPKSWQRSARSPHPLPPPQSTLPPGPQTKSQPCPYTTSQHPTRNSSEQRDPTASARGRSRPPNRN